MIDIVRIVIGKNIIHEVCTYVLNQKEKNLAIKDLLFSMECKKIYSVNYSKSIANLIWKRVIEELIRQHGASCVTKSLAMYRMSLLMGWKAKIHFSLPETSQDNAFGHAYIEIYDDIFGFDNMRQYLDVFVYEGGNFNGNTQD